MTSTQRTAVITGVGAERGIGRATAHRFARDGWAIAGLDLDGQAAEKLASELTERYGVPAFGAAVDVASEESVLSVRDAIRAAGLPTVGAVLNIAGITSPVPFLDTTVELWNRIFAVNVTGTYLCCAAAVPAMLSQEPRGGSIINIGSVAGLVAVSRRFAYCATKGAVIALSKSIATDYAGTGLRCNCICPGTVYSPFVESYLDRFHKDTKEETIVELHARQPIGRMGRPDEIAGLAVYLAADESSFMTGSAVTIDGGLTAR